MAKGKRAKLRKQQRTMEVEEAAGGSGGGDGGWVTGPIEGGEDLITMDTAEAGQAASIGAAAGAPKLKGFKRGQGSRKQQARKRKSMDRALAVASRKETKVKQQEGMQVKLKGLKKLWQNEKKEG